MLKLNPAIDCFEPNRLARCDLPTQQGLCDQGAYQAIHHPLKISRAATAAAIPSLPTTKWWLGLPVPARGRDNLSLLFCGDNVANLTCAQAWSTQSNALSGNRKSLADPAPSSKWISSMKRIGFGSRSSPRLRTAPHCDAARTTASSRSSNSPRYFVPATSEVREISITAGRQLLRHAPGGNQLGKSLNQSNF